MMRRRVGTLAAIAAVSGVVGACVLAEPATDLPALPDLRPTIVRASVVPTASAVLLTWPQRFIVPVEIIDARVTLIVATFVDYNSQSAVGLDSVTTDEYGRSAQSGNIRTIEVEINRPSDDRCHLVEIIVARNLNTATVQNAHTPLDPGGDIVSWFYNPSGNLDGCPSVDAGISPVDAGDDGGDAAP